MKRFTFILLGVGIGLLSLSTLTAVLRHNNRTLLAKDEAVTYAIVDIGSLGSGESEAADINNAVEIVGSSSISGEEGPAAFHWHERSMTPLTDTKVVSSQALAINDAGAIVGTGLSGSGETAKQWPILWAGENGTLLPTPEDAPGMARAVNNQGLIAGNTIAGSDNQLLLWQGESLTETIPVSGGVGWANGINDSSQLVGTIEEMGGSSSAFLWQAGGFTELGTLGGSSSAAHDINDAAQIVGSASISDDLSSHAFLWADGEMQDLGGLGEVFTATSKAMGINNPGTIVGQAQLGDEDHAVMWQEGQIVDVNILLPPDSDWDLLISAESINDHGWIAGTGLIDGQKRAFVLQPQGYKQYLPVVAAVEQTATPTPMPTATLTITPTSSPTVTPTMEPTDTPTPTPIPNEAVDLTKFMVGDGRIYEVQHSSGSQARHQTQIDKEDDKVFYHTKGYRGLPDDAMLAEWEELWSTLSYIYRGTDTSPGNDEYYTLYEDSTAGSHWAPRYWKVGEIYERNPYVVFYRKSDCSIVASGFQRSWLRFENLYDEFTFDSGITLDNVIKLAWLLHPAGQPIENYFYAEDFGLVGWGSNDRGFSYISEIHGPGQRPDNVREEIPCITQELKRPLIANPELNFGPLPEPYASRVK